MRQVFFVILCLALACGISALSGVGLPFWAVGLLGGAAILGLFALAGHGPATAQESVSGPRQLGATPGDQAAQKLPEGVGQALLRHLPVPLIVVSAQGKVSFANRAAFDLAPQLLEEAHISLAIRVPGFLETVADVLEDGQEREVAFEMARSQKFYEALVSPIDGGARIDRGDWTAIIRIEDRTQARQNALARTDFVANASHELRTPLASLLGYIETMRGHARDDPEAQERFLGIMDKQAQRMKRLVNDLMSLSKIELEAHILPQEVVDLVDVFSETASALEPVAQKRGCAIVNKLPGKDVFVRGDRDQMLQVAVNLIDNAIKYGGKDGTVTIALEAVPEKIGISISDTGPGINRVHVRRLTERFYRVNTAMSREVGGTGLGLAIVKHILNRHQGTLDIVSEPGAGSKFTAWLPLAQDSTKESL